MLEQKHTMTDKEIKINEQFSNEFDVLYNSITSNQAPGLDEYEKSIFLNRAQDEIAKSYFNPKTNKVQEGFDGTERRQIDFSMITKSRIYENFDTSLFDSREQVKSVTIEDDILMLINEYLEVSRGRAPITEGPPRPARGKQIRLTVLPITYVEYSRLMSKPYKWPLKNQAWRLMGNRGGRKNVELIAGPFDTITKYAIRYIKRPRAIRLADFGNMTIDGESTPQCCELDPILFPEIIQRACELASAVYKGDLQSQLVLGQTSQTNIGMVTQSR